MLVDAPVLDKKYESKYHIAFDGVNEYGNIPAGEHFYDAAGTTGGTISMWVRSSDLFPANNNGTKIIFGNYNQTGMTVQAGYLQTRRKNNTNQIYWFRQKLVFSPFSINAYISHHATPPSDEQADDTWHHIVLTLKAVSGNWVPKMYWNGSELTLTGTNPSVVDLSDSNMPLTLTRYNTSYDEFDLNEVITYSFPLTATQVQWVYNQGVSGFDATKAAGGNTMSQHLYSWYKMGDVKGANNTEPDSSGNDRDMTLVNDPAIEIT